MSSATAYPFLRATKMFLRISAAIYLVLGILLAVGISSDMVSTGTREAIVWIGGPEKGNGGFAAFMLLVSVGLKTMLILAVSEMIQLLLDVRNDTRPRV